MSRDLIDRSKGRWSCILISLGIDERFLKSKKGPCPICGGKDRFRFDNKNSSGSWICNHCGPGYGVHLHQKINGLTIAQAMADIERVLNGVSGNVTSVADAPRPVRNDLPRAKEIWDGAVAVSAGDAVAKYLKGRGLEWTPSTAIRLDPRLLYLDDEGNFAGRMPGMVAVIQDQAGEAAGIHRTYLRHDGSGQASVPMPKKVLGKLPDGGAVRLTKALEHLGIAEGIETALAAAQLFGIPTWAALTAGALEKWSPPAGTGRVTVFGDNDASFTGQAAAYGLAKRLKARGYQVDVRMPLSVGQDWNDVLRSDAANRKDQING
ncbi:toprim domain-containing protein [Rhizobium sp. KVB221]|uniref:Toprim domain-containing protein n=1 Tax=Rhizobium setariae TaxID=2801340 RepID=A0A937CR69_9HYPH|nr:toprim domain-containing protein [Rhizobium setariae]MBL0374017.1 toprim domain-containing protein [Rhizobium setariae]